jgi:hypothetical protein
VLVATGDGIVPVVDGRVARPELTGRSVHALTRRRSEWWAVADGRTLVRRDQGEWHDVATASERITALWPAPGGAWCGTADGQLLRTFDGQLAPNEQFAAVEGRDTWHAVGSKVPYVRSITTTSDDRALLASVHVGGIPRSGNGGATWRPTIDPEADVHQVRAHPSDPALVLAATAVGLAVSRDAGTTWTVVTEGLHATYLRAVAFTPDAALVSACDGPFGSKGALYRWDTLAGGSLTRVTGGLPEWLAGNVDTGVLDADGSVAACADREAVYVSTDAAQSWQRVEGDLGTVQAVAVSDSD